MDSNMDSYEWNECETNDLAAITDYLSQFSKKQKELVLLKDGETVGAILTKEQYTWFLDQIDARQNLDFIEQRKEDFEGAQSMEDLKKELGL